MNHEAVGTTLNSLSYLTFMLNEEDENGSIGLVCCYQVEFVGLLFES